MEFFVFDESLEQLDHCLKAELLDEDILNEREPFNEDLVFLLCLLL